MAKCEKVAPHLHLPFQSGSDKILKLMNRRYTKASFFDLIESVKAKMPDIALTSDVIVGFPGETYEDFLETLDLIEKVRFDSLFTFIYSPREGTKAKDMPGELKYSEKLSRFKELLAVQNKISKEMNDEYLKRRVKVLCEGKSKTDESVMTGHTPSGKIVNFKCSSDMLGSFADVEITKCKTWSLDGKIIKNESGDVK